MSSQDAGETHAADHANFGADELHGCHQRQRDQRRPQGCVAELGPRDGIRADARRVVVRSAGDQARAENPEVALEPIALDCRGRFERRCSASGLLMRNVFARFPAGRLVDSAHVRCQKSTQRAIAVGT